MTREQAISELMQMYGMLSPSKQIAIDEAVKALKQEPCVGSDECKEVIKAYFDGQADKWIPINEDDPTTFPEPGKYVLLSFANNSIPSVGYYEQDEDGGGRFFLADDSELPLVKFGIFVNAWMSLPECYKEE